MCVLGARPVKPASCSTAQRASPRHSQWYLPCDAQRWRDHRRAGNHRGDRAQCDHKACESDSPNDAWLRFSGSLKVQKNIFTLAAISLVQASMFLEPDWVGAKRQDK